MAKFSHLLAVICISICVFGRFCTAIDDGDIDDDNNDEIPDNVLECFEKLNPVIRRYKGYLAECQSSLSEPDPSATTAEILDEENECYRERKSQDTEGKAQIMSCGELMAHLSFDKQVKANELLRSQIQNILNEN